MMKFTRFFILVLVLAVLLPALIDTALNFKKENVNISYSEILDDFVIQTSKQKKPLYFKRGGEKLSFEEYMSALPFSFYSYLLANDIFPYDEWKDAKKIRENSQKLSIKPEIFNQKFPPIFTLFESNPKYLKLGYNEFAITSDKNGLKFTSLNTLKSDENLSQAFTNSLLNLGFKFPIKSHFTNPTTKKPFDEGAFLVDFNDELFHLKMRNLAPIAKKTGVKGVEFMLVSENERREFYGAVIREESLDGANSDGNLANLKDENSPDKTPQNRAFKKQIVSLVSYDDYALMDLPSSRYNPASDKLELTITPLSRSMSVKSDEAVYAYRLGKTYGMLEEFEYKRAGESSRLKERILPFEIFKTSTYAYEFGLSSLNFKAFWLNLVLFAVAIFVFRRQKERFLKAGLILVFGIYGFLAGLVV